MNRFPLPRCASAIQIVFPLESIAETQPQLQPALLRLSLTLGIVDHSQRRFTHFKLCAHFLDLRCLLFRRRGPSQIFKKARKHEHSLALYFMHYNFCRIHQTLRVTPAMEAGITDHVLSLDEVIDLP
jgi:hypothetical protein